MAGIRLPESNLGRFAYGLPGGASPNQGRLAGIFIFDGVRLLGNRCGALSFLQDIEVDHASYRRLGSRASSF